MSISVSSARRAAVGAIGAGAVAGGLLLGAVGTAQAAPTPASMSGPVSTAADVNAVIATGMDNTPMPDWWLHHRLFHHWWWFW